MNWKLDLGVGVDYPQPRSIGADRLANAAAVAQLYGVPAIVVDFGTAVTFDVVSAAGDYVGGVIAPGLEVMTNYLYQRTALLPKCAPFVRRSHQRLMFGISPAITVADPAVAVCSVAISGLVCRSHDGSDGRCHA